MSRQGGCSGLSRPARRSPWSWPGLWCIALASVLCLLTWPVSAQNSPPTSRLGPADYEIFLADWLIVKLQLAASRSALETALAEKRSIERLLSEQQQRIDALLASATEHSDDSKRLYEEALEEAERLRQRLTESESMAAELRMSLESAEEKYGQELAKAQARAKALERENRLLKIGCGLLAAGILGLGIWEAIR